jgi:hypothetical protein
MKDVWIIRQTDRKKYKYLLKKADKENICTFVSTSISSSSAIFKDTVIKIYILESL